MTRVFCLFTIGLLQALFAASAAHAQDAPGSFVPQGTVWKKDDVLRTSTNVEQIAFSANGALAILASHQGVSVWDWKKEREARYFPFPQRTKVAALALRGEGDLLATAHLDSSRYLVWNVAKGELLNQINHGTPVRALIFAPDGKHIASGGGHTPEEKAGADNYIQLSTIAAGKSEKRFFGPDRPIRTIALTASTLVAEDDKGEAYLWNRVTGKQAGKISTHSFVTPLAMIQGGKILVGYEVGSGRFLTRWDSALQKKEQLIDMSPTAQGARHGFWANADGSLAATSHPGEIIIWDLKSKDRRATLTIPRDPQVTALAFVPNSSEVVVALSDDAVLRLSVPKAR